MNSHIANLIEHSDEQNTRSSLPRRVVSLLMLALAGYCFWQGSGLFAWEDSARTIAAVASQTESSVVPDALPITQIDVGDWVFAARNPSSSDDESSSVSTEVDSSAWRLMVLKAYKPNGQPMEVRMLRPLVWLDQHNAQPGKNIYISSEELGFFGDMLVKEIHPCPQLMPRPGPGYEVVTATFRHRRADVIDLTVQDVAEPIGTTPNHPFWSEDRQTFTPAGDLFVGEKLRLANGNLTYVTKTTPRSGTHWVYNLEVNTQHVYHVSDAGLLVHNSNACGRVASKSGATALAVVPKRYRSAIRRSFKSDPTAVTLAEDIVVYRHWGGKASKTGSPWFSPKPYANPGNAQRYLALPSGNTAQKVTKFRIPAGTTILRGKVASQAGNSGFGVKSLGNGTQIYIPDPSVAVPF